MGIREDLGFTSSGFALAVGMCKIDKRLQRVEDYRSLSPHSLCRLLHS